MIKSYRVLLYLIISGLLLGSGDVDVNCRGDLAEWTPLHNAASNGHAESIEMLIEKNAIIDITDMVGKSS